MLQLICEVAYTVAPVLHVIVSFCPVACPDTEFAFPPAAEANAAEQAFALWQTLQPSPPQPVSHWQLVMLPKSPDPERETLLRAEPWKIVPPHAGTEQFWPP
jgi:hypothetical protein